MRQIEEYLSIASYYDLSGLDIRVWIAMELLFEELGENTKITSRQVADKAGIVNKTYKQTVSVAKKRLMDYGILTNELKEVFKPSERIGICGIYCIKKDDLVYVGMSTDIENRWKDHRTLLNKKEHKYFPQVDNSDQVKFTILHECHEEKLRKYEMLCAQKLKSQGLTVLNEDNWSLL